MKSEILKIVRDELSDATEISLSEKGKREITESVKSSILEGLDGSITAFIRSEIHSSLEGEGLARSVSKRKVRLANDYDVRCADG